MFSQQTKILEHVFRWIFAGELALRAWATRPEPQGNTKHHGASTCPQPTFIDLHELLGNTTKFRILSRRMSVSRQVQILPEPLQLGSTLAEFALCFVIL